VRFCQPTSTDTLAPRCLSRTSCPKTLLFGWPQVLDPLMLVCSGLPGPKSDVFGHLPRAKLSNDRSRFRKEVRAFGSAPGSNSGRAKVSSFDRSARKNCETTQPSRAVFPPKPWASISAFTFGSIPPPLLASARPRSRRSRRRCAGASYP
jgi:hypothetical protein